MDKQPIQEYLETLNLSEAAKAFYLRFYFEPYRTFGFVKTNDFNVIQELVKAKLILVGIKFFNQSDN